MRRKREDNEKARALAEKLRKTVALKLWRRKSAERLGSEGEEAVEEEEEEEEENEEEEVAAKAENEEKEIKVEETEEVNQEMQEVENEVEANEPGSIESGRAKEVRWVYQVSLFSIARLECFTCAYKIKRFTDPRNSLL